MFNYLNYCSRNRRFWLVLVLTTFSLELMALYFQYLKLLEPCVLCIYQRCALYGIVAAGLIGAIAPTTLLRFIGLFLWIYSAWQGLLLAVKHVNIQLHPSPFITCDFFVNFPHWLPLDKWLPEIFSASGDCAKSQWHFLLLGIPQWMIIIFSIYLILAIIILLAQFICLRKGDLLDY